MSYGILVDIPTALVNDLTTQASVASGREPNQKGVNRPTRLPHLNTGSDQDGKRTIAHILALGDKTLTQVYTNEIVEKCECFLAEGKPKTRPFRAKVKNMLQSETKVWNYQRTEQRFALSPESFIDQVYVDGWGYSNEEKKQVANNAVMKSTRLGLKIRNIVLTTYKDYADEDILNIHEVGMRATSNRTSGFMNKGERLLITISETGIQFPVEKITSTDEEKRIYLQLDKKSDPRIACPIPQPTLLIDDSSPPVAVPILADLKILDDANKLIPEKKKTAAPIVVQKSSPKKTLKTTSPQPVRQILDEPISKKEQKPNDDKYMAAFKRTYERPDLLRFLSKYEEITRATKRATRKELLGRLEKRIAEDKESQPAVVSESNTKVKRKSEIKPAVETKRPNTGSSNVGGTNKGGQNKEPDFDFKIEDQTAETLNVLSHRYNSMVDAALLPRRNILSDFISDVSNIVSLESPPENAEELHGWYQSSSIQANETLREYLTVLGKLKNARSKIIFAQRMLACGSVAKTL